ncbi:N utilization substance protein B [Kaistia sp. 32K]|uniref:transcription antitermination factor NusB n=1 Tax=Kaistia sp. 32K TaxID=2795690 RepID=UPI00191615EA|nr:transcription antitermination factor NusB [Kaistia sp. 32K]BCP53356.1 N utilization substance protein B [Kaistia sp. 32K]
MAAPDKAPQTARTFRPANQRGAARLAAVQALYQLDVGGASLTEVVAEFENYRLGKELDGDQYRDADAAFFRDIIAGVVREQRNLDPAIHVSLTPDWPLKRIDVTLRAILRCGTYELIGRKDVPARVVITEYVDIARAFFGVGDEAGMVNGVLDTVARKLRGEEFGDASTNDKG